MALRGRASDPWELVLDVLGLGMIVTWLITSWGASWALVGSVSVAMITALLLRRRALIPTLVATVAAVLLSSTYSSNSVGPWAVAQIVLFSWTLRLPRARSVWVAVSVATLLLVLSVAAYPLGSPGLPLGVVAWTFGVWGLATSIAAQRELLLALAQRAEELERDREREIQRRLTDQRMQIARDLHDELAHNVAVIAVNAGAAEAALPPAADTAREALRTVRSTARAVLSELQEILGLLRSEGTRESVLPQLTDILEAARELGLQAEVDGDWVPASEPASSHVTAARVLQESLTNARRHGAGSHARVSMTTSNQTWTMCVENPVEASARMEPSRSGGFGVIGMTERAELVGGRFKSARQGEVWRSSLSLPLRSSQAERG